MESPDRAVSTLHSILQRSVTGGFLSKKEAEGRDTKDRKYALFAGVGVAIPTEVKSVAIPVVVALSWGEYTGIVPTSFNRSRTGSHCTTRNLSLPLRSPLPVHLEGRGNRPPAISHHSWPAGAFPPLSQAWLAKYDSHWPPAQPRSTRIHLHSPFSLAVQARWPRSSSSLIENLYGFLRLYYFLFQ